MDSRVSATDDRRCAGGLPMNRPSAAAFGSRRRMMIVGRAGTSIEGGGEAFDSRSPIFLRRLVDERLAAVERIDVGLPSEQASTVAVGLPCGGLFVGRRSSRRTEAFGGWSCRGEILPPSLFRRRSAHARSSGARRAVGLMIARPGVVVRLQKLLPSSFLLQTGVRPTVGFGRFLQPIV